MDHNYGGVDIAINGHSTLSLFCYSAREWHTCTCTCSLRYPIFNKFPGRQFKEAGRLANESKVLSAKLDEERSEVTSTRSQLDELNKKLSDLSEQLNALRSDTNAQEKKEGKPTQI